MRPQRVNNRKSRSRSSSSNRKVRASADDLIMRQQYQQEFAQKEEVMRRQVTTLKETAATRMQQLVEAVTSGQGGGWSGPSSSSTPGGGQWGSPGVATADLRQRISKAIEIMQRGLVERDTEVRLLLLAALAREHILYIGPPGTAKSELSRRLSKIYRGAYFERLLTRFSVPEELFGPLSMRALEEDKYVRQTDGYLPDASVAFVDEIFKANSAILNTLLTILNERLFDNGSVRAPVPLVCMVGASNELPESEELNALYDRFLLRKGVTQVSAGGLTQLLSQGDLLYEEFQVREEEAWQLLRQEDFDGTRPAAVANVRVPREVVELLADLRTYLQEKCEPPVYVSDRRLVKAVQLMQVAAYTNGRTAVSVYDCLLLQHIMWNTPDEAERIYDWLLGQLAADDGMKQMDYLLSGMFGRACKSLSNEEECGKIRAEVAQLREVLSDKLAEVAGSLGGTFPAVTDNMWLGADEAAAVASALLPKLEKTKEEVGRLLYEVVQLEVALEDTRDAVALAEILPQRWSQFIRAG